MSYHIPGLSLLKIETMSLNIIHKLRIKAGDTLLTINEPKTFKQVLQPLPASVKIVSSVKTYQQLHWFLKHQSQLEKEMIKVLPLIHTGVICWIYYPKGSSSIQTDLTRDKGWEALLAHGDTLTWISLISFDETWSTFGCRLKTNADKKKDTIPRQREILQYIDAEKKTIRLPEDLSKLLKKNKKAWIFFNSLSFTNRKEYVEWIITAKREETKKERLDGTIERLMKEWKNPRNL